MTKNKTYTEIPYWDSSMLYCYDAEDGISYIDELIAQGFILKDRVGHDALFEIYFFFNKNKDLHLIDIWDGQTFLFRFMCKSRKASMECFQSAVRLGLDYLNFHSGCEQWGKE